MQKENFNVFCPECNMLVEAKVITDATGEFQSDELNPDDEVDVQWLSLVRKDLTNAYLMKEKLHDDLHDLDKYFG